MRIVRATHRLAPGHRGVIVAVELESSAIGFGECAPLQGYSPESLEDAIAALDNMAAQCTFTELNADSPWDASKQLSLRAPNAPKSALFALETACMDAMARARGVSMAVLIGDEPPRALPRNALIDLRSPTLERDVVRLREDGYSAFKAKVRPDMLPDLARTTRVLRAAAGHDAELRFDANGQFSNDEAAELLRQLEPVRPSYVEEPTRGMSMLSLASRAMALGADESLQDSVFATQALETPCVAAFVLKPALHGMRRARELARDAMSRGKRIVVSHMQDGPIGLAAACELALSLGTRDACGLDPHAGLAQWPPLEVPQLRAPASVQPHEGFGHGVAWRLP